MTDNKILLFLFGVIVLLYGVKSSVEVYLSSGGIEVAAVKDEVYAWQVKNSELRNQVLQEQSLGAIYWKARSMGFVNAKYINL